ncbi:hypothetical protein BC939DRAFT_474887 [Gamsiella multidivaricata]|uniref:uncharacterized protein n=1 Tax=Gamsiella multidivaricata TaxID=101098 RepID=UPI00221EDCCD|nr:uncharacterized protein BC939DRAFT_474887 [Gamsiella multidivaricata]KAI7828159.1 hypothetical protein BC939DRAFT_474887 [Gamsiella multidivaricata]
MDTDTSFENQDGEWRSNVQGKNNEAMLVDQDEERTQWDSSGGSQQHSRCQNYGDGFQGKEKDGGPRWRSTCQECVQRLRSQHQFHSVNSLTFRGTIIVPEVVAFFPNLGTLALEEGLSRLAPYPSFDSNGFSSRADTDGCMNNNDSNRGGAYGSGNCSSSFCMESDSDSMDVTVSRLSSMVDDLAQTLLNGCPSLHRLVLNEPLLVDDYLGQELHRHGGPQRLTLVLKAIPRLEQFVVHSKVVARCPGLVETLLEYHYPHLTSFQVLDDAEQQHQHQLYQQQQQYSKPPFAQTLKIHHLLISLNNNRSNSNNNDNNRLLCLTSIHLAHPLQRDQLQSQPLPHRSQQLYQQRYHEQQQYQEQHDPNQSQRQQAPFLQQTLETQRQEQQQLDTLLQLRKACFRILECCPQLQTFESKVPLSLQDLIASIPRWACGHLLTVLRLEIQELTVDERLDLEEEEVMQMFIKSLFKGTNNCGDGNISGADNRSDASLARGSQSQSINALSSLSKPSSASSPFYPSSDSSYNLPSDRSSGWASGSGAGSGAGSGSDWSRPASAASGSGASGSSISGSDASSGAASQQDSISSSSRAVYSSDSSSTSSDHSCTPANNSNDNCNSNSNDCSNNNDSMSPTPSSVQLTSILPSNLPTVTANNTSSGSDQSSASSWYQRHYLRSVPLPHSQGQTLGQGYEHRQGQGGRHRLPLPPPPPPPPPPANSAMPMSASSSLASPGGCADYCQFKSVGRLIALQFLVEHHLIYLPKLDRFFLGNRR